MEIVRTKTFSNGFTLVYVPHKVRSVTCCLRGLAGSNYETTKQVGAAHLLEHIHLLGSNNFPTTKQLHALVKRNGGRVTGTTSRDDVAYLTKALKENYKDGIVLLAEVFLNPKLDKKIIQVAKNVVRHEINQNIENPTRHIGRLAYKVLFPRQRFASYNTGSVAQVNKLSLSEIKKYREKHYVPQNFVLSVCGDLHWKSLAHEVSMTFGKAKAGTTQVTLKHRQSRGLGIQVENRQDGVQLHLKIDYYGHKTSSAAKYAAAMLAMALKQELVAQISKSESSFPYLLDVASFSSNTYGLFGLYTSISEKDLENFLRLFKKSALKVTTKEISEEQLQLLKNKIAADIEFTLEKTSLRADYYSELFLYENDAKSHLEELAAFSSVTANDIKAVALDLFMQEPKITVIAKKLTDKDVKRVWENA